MDTIKIQATIKIPKQRISDLLTSAFEGGSNYWMEYVGDTPPKDTSFPWADEITRKYPYATFPLEAGGLIMVEDNEAIGNDSKVFELSLKAIKRGLKLMPKKYPKAWADFMDENDDAETADIFLQLCLFGEVIYG